MPKALHIE